MGLLDRSDELANFFLGGGMLKKKLSLKSRLISLTPGKRKICSLLSKTTWDGFSMKTPWLTPSYTPPSCNGITISEYRRLLFSLPHGKGAGMTLSRGRNSLTNQPLLPHPACQPAYAQNFCQMSCLQGPPLGHAFLPPFSLQFSPTQGENQKGFWVPNAYAQPFFQRI